jgi:hypothetical protein
MPTLPTSEWTAALDRMTFTLNQTIADLDRYQVEWATFSEAPAVLAPPDLLLKRMEQRLSEWDARLNAAAELAKSVEMHLEDREAAVERWHEVFVRWNELIQRKVDTSNTFPG